MVVDYSLDHDHNEIIIRVYKENNKMKIKPLFFSAAMLVTIQMVPVQAEILAIGPNAKVLKKASVPTMGQTMKTVHGKFGAAKRVSVSKGKVTKRNPKITRWDYPTFSVFFENSHVIHSVVHR